MGTDSSPAGRHRPADPGRPVDAAAVLAERLFGDVVGALELFGVYLGDQLGLYRALNTGGPATSAELAARTGTAERYVREWLEHQAGKVARALKALEAAPPPHTAPPDVGQITLACALGYRDFRFPGSWRADHPRLVAWLAEFSVRVPAFDATMPPPE